MYIDLDPDSIRFRGSNGDPRSLIKVAVELALLGEVDIARNLFEVLPPMEENQRPNSLLSRGLYLAWKETNRWPTNLTDQEFIQQTEKTAREFYTESWGGVREDKRTLDEKGLEACLATESESNTRTHNPETPSESQRLIKALDISLRLAGPLNQQELSADDGRATKRTKLSDGTAASKNESADAMKVSDLDSRSANILKSIAAKWNASELEPCLADAESLWPYWIRGILMDALGLEREEVQEKGRKLLQLFSKRYESGYVPSRVDGKSMRELLEMANDLTLSDNNPEAVDYWTEGGMEERPETLWREPSTDAEIAEMEERLKVSPPDDYKDFLRISNGFGAIFNGIIAEPELYTTDEVSWTTCDGTFSELYFGLLELPSDIMELISTDQADIGLEGSMVLRDSNLGDTIVEIGNEDMDHIWLLQPERVERYRALYMQIYEKANEYQKKVIIRAMEAFAGSKEAFEALEWCCLTWASGGAAQMNAYSSFKRYLEDVVSDSLEKKLEATRASASKE